MFRHKGISRTHKHNLQIASLLSFVAGIVNVAGFLAVERLTTNVTGHFAFFVDEVFKIRIWEAFIFFLYIFFFLLGSFTCGILTEALSKRLVRYSYIIPIIIESLLLFTVAFAGHFLIGISPDTVAFILLFAMGLQNSLVTNISNAVVRTTHLTGLFTDLGIELSQLFFYRQKEQKVKLYTSIRLRFTIIGSFFLGGLLSGTFYYYLQLGTLAIAAAILLAGAVFDEVKSKLSNNRQGTTRRPAALKR